MKKLLYFRMRGCPHCARADRFLNELRAQNPRYQAIPIREVDENAERAFADAHDYWYVPCFFVDGVKRHEGAITLEQMETVLKACLD